MRRLSATRAFLALVVTLSVVVPVGAALTGCPYAREAALRATPTVSDPVDCAPGATRCIGALPVRCSPVAVPGSSRHREWPSLPHAADGSQRVCLYGCAMTDGGAACIGPDASTDGGAR